MMLARLAVIALLGCATTGCRAATQQYMCRARQEEAQTNLKGLHEAQAAYFTANKKYAASIAELGYTPPQNKYYDLTVEAVTATGYTATASGKGEASGDVWTVDQTGKPTVTTDKCHAK